LSGYSPALPLEIDPIDGFALTKNFAEVAKQNFKMLVLTNPGERIMDSEFGVGIAKFLFEPDGFNTRENIRDRIVSQTKKYLPYIILEDINIQEDERFFSTINVKIRYRVDGLNFTDELNISA